MARLERYDSLSLQAVGFEKCGLMNFHRDVDMLINYHLDAGVMHPWAESRYKATVVIKFPEIPAFYLVNSLSAHFQDGSFTNN